MPSAEKVTTCAASAKLESAPPNEPKAVENPQKENQQNASDSVPAIQQVLSILNNKVRNLEKRKVSDMNNFPWRISIKSVKL